MFLTFQQLLEYEDFLNDTQYEEYEIYEDDFDFAERERAETLHVEVNLVLKLGSHVISSFFQVISENLFPSFFFYYRLYSEQRKARRENQLILNR